jgi:hypothetical protein
MAGRKQSKSGQQQAGLPVEDYRHEGATRPNNPPAAIAAKGRTPAAPRVSYAYSPRLDPALRSDPSGQADALPPLLEKATREKLTPEEAALLAEALRRHEPWLEWAGKRETPGFAVDPVALHIHERVSTQAILRAWSLILTDAAERDIAAINLLAERFQPRDGFWLQATISEFLNAIGDAPFQKAPVIGWRLGAKEAAPLLLQVADIGVRQSSKPGWRVLLWNGRDNDCGLDWLGWCGSFHAVPFLLGFACRRCRAVK